MAAGGVSSIRSVRIFGLDVVVPVDELPAESVAVSSVAMGLPVREHMTGVPGPGRSPLLHALVALLTELPTRELAGAVAIVVSGFRRPQRYWSLCNWWAGGKQPRRSDSCFHSTSRMPY